MKKRYIAIFAVIVIVMVVVGFKGYDVYKKYTIPEEIYYGVGESFEYDGLRFALKDMEVFDLDGIVERLQLENMTEQLRQNEVLGKRKYFLATLELTALEEGYGKSAEGIKAYTEYCSGDILSLDIMMTVNDCLGYPDMEVGETTEYYVVFNALDIYYTDETFEDMGTDDVYLRILDMEKGCAYCMHKK